MADEPRIPLDDFCRDLSTRESRVELIAAFHFTAKSASQLFDTESNYQASFSRFLKQ